MRRASVRFWYALIQDDRLGTDPALPIARAFGMVVVCRLNY